MEELKLFLYKFAHAAVTVLMFFVFWVLYRYGSFSFIEPDRFRYNFYVAAMFAVLMAFFGKTYNIYLLGYNRARSLAISQLMSQLFPVAICYVLTSLAWAKWLNPILLIVLVILYAGLDAAWSWYGNILYFRFNPPLKALLIYGNELDRKRIMQLKGKPTQGVYTIVKCVKCGGRVAESLIGIIERYDAVFVSGIDADTRNGIVKYCVETGIPGFFLPRLEDIMVLGAKHIQSFTSPVLSVSRAKPDWEYLIVKRAIDIVASLIGIIVLSPVMLAVAVAVRLEDGGPALYRQVRLTQNSREFEIFKFRSMRVNAEADGVARMSIGKDDNRITKVGRFIRMCRLDELPQLFNILKGDMTIVGPRPERPEIAEDYYVTFPEFKLRLQVKAGLTGYAQVYGKYNTEPYEKLEFDLLYINNMSLLTDIKLMFATLGILFKKESTEGVKKGEEVKKHTSLRR